MGDRTLSPNRTDKRFSITATDVGVSWDNGSGQVLMAFGDTWGKCNGALVWRHNTMLRAKGSSDVSKGITFPNARPGDIRSGASVTGTADVRAAHHQRDRHPEHRGRAHPDGGHFDRRRAVPVLHVDPAVGRGRSVGDRLPALASSHDNGQTWQVQNNTIRSRYELNLPGVPQTSTGRAASR